MATLYEIDSQIREMLDNSIDMETGEILLDEEALNQLQIDREKKIENICLYIKEQTAFADALRKEEQELAKRRRTMENKVERLKKYLSNSLNGEKFETTRAKVTFRNSSKVEVDDEFISWAKESGKELLRYKEPEPDKTVIKKMLSEGIMVPHTMLQVERSITIK